MPLSNNTPESNMLHIPDEEYLVQMAEGSRQAFTELYNRYWEDLYVTAAKVLREQKEAEDVVQDVFLSMWNRRNELNIQGSLAAYLHTSVRYKCIHYIEKNITRRDYLGQLVDVMMRSAAANAEINLQLKEMQETVNKAVSKMPGKMQQVYILSRQQGLSHKEIAGYMHISVETVKKHIQHALNLIRKDLFPYTIVLFIMFFLCLR